MTTTRLREGRVPIPDHIRQAVHLEEGDEIEIQVTDEGILLRPIHEPELDLSWFETPEGRARLQEDVDAVRSGSQWSFESGEEFVATLERLAADHADV
jgi:antitoxin PrlF